MAERRRQEPGEERRESNPQPAAAAQPAGGSREAAGGSAGPGTAVDARMELGIGPHESTLMEVSSTHLDAYPLHPHQTAENNTPDVLTVQVQTDAGGVQELLVEVERPGHRKKFLGGYRHQLTGVEFHHAAVQTLQKKRPDRGVEAFSRDTQTTSQSQSDTLLCRSCHRFQPASRFDLPAGCRRISRCRACSALDHVSRARRDVCSYKKLLLRLRAEEQQLGGDATITFLLQAEDLRYLVEDVWTFCPAKESSHLDGLDLVRWDRRRAWSPWNCFLLPREESSSHLQVEDLQQVYEAVFIRSVEYKHLVAWRHFSQNPAMVDYLRSHPAAGPNNQLLPTSVSTETEQAAAAGAAT
ncbi:unnamed protein product [Tetraodon nigroviridis]|uniref:(spotted green pufferfish) hypothetical protein n=1 Tax=Tetraodon nigroviridis TaxID=99883 RepID=Q4SE59_TETNG|nr:unnamed protein product [Tetraodon nigroviridis]